MGSLLRDKGRTSGYIEAFTSIALPSVDEVRQMPPDEITRPLRKLQMYWAILSKAGFAIDEKQLRDIAPTGSVASRFNPGFSEALREAAYKFSEEEAPDSPSTLPELRSELEVIAQFRRERQSDKALKSTGTSGKQVFESDDIALLEFLAPPAGRSGVSLLQPFRHYHDDKAGDFQSEILRLLDEGQTVILDLGNANPEVMAYFSNELSKAVFAHQVDKFTNNNLGDHFVQVYFEEAHNLFPKTESKPTIYTRFAKEGAKYHIGMVYSTQSPTTVNHDLLAQTENFFIAHLSSQDEVNALAKMNVSFDGLQDDILRSSTRGYIRMLTRSHRFVVPVQAKKFEVKISPQEKSNAVSNRGPSSSGKVEPAGASGHSTK